MYIEICTYLSFHLDQLVSHARPWSDSHGQEGSGLDASFVLRRKSIRIEFLGVFKVFRVHVQWVNWNVYLQTQSSLFYILHYV